MQRFYIFLVFLLVSYFSIGQTITPAGTVNICAGGSQILTVQGAPAGATFQWKNGAGNITGETKITYEAKSDGDYSVVINDDTEFGLVKIIVNPLPVIDFTFDNNICSGTSVSFKAIASVGKAPFTYQWDFGDTKTGTGQNVNHTFTAIGCGSKIFKVKLTVTDANGCKAVKEYDVSVVQAPDVKIDDVSIFEKFRNCEKQPTVLNPNYTLTIKNISPGAGCISSYIVDWGDGSAKIVNATFPLTHTYTKLGAFNLEVTAVGTNGCPNTFTQIVANQSNPAGGLSTLGSTTGLCVPALVPFIINDWQNNSPGTIYRLNFDDDKIIELTHPLNGTMVAHRIEHLYEESSCPKSTYTAKLDVINACDITPYTAGNIQVRNGPTAAFTSFPNPTCNGQNVCFTNTTKAGTTGSRCSDDTEYTWDFGDPSSGTQNSSSVSDPCHVFSKAGKYTVTLIASNPCGTSEYKMEVCVNEKIVPAFILNQTVGCSPLSVQATNNSNAGNSCSPSSYKWAVSYSSGNCGTSGDWNFTNSTTANSENPSFLFKNPGIYTITLSATNSCGTFTSSKNIEVKAPPKVTLGTAISNCGPFNFTPKATVQNCGKDNLTYLWTFPNGVPSSSTLADPGNVVFSIPGTHIITLEVKNECGSTKSTQSITINPFPELTVPEDVFLCQGETSNVITLTSASSGAGISWSSTNGFSIGMPSSGGISIPKFTATNSGKALIDVRATLGLCAVNKVFSITVNPKPPKPTTSNVTYCQNETALPLTANATAGNTLLWYTTASGGTGVTEAIVPKTNTVGIINYYVSQVSTSGKCESDRVAVAVKINPIPKITSHTPVSPDKCGASTGKIILKGLTGLETYEVFYKQDNIPQSKSLKANSSGEIELIGLPKGLYTNIYVKLNGCISVSIPDVELVDPTRPEKPVIANVDPICSGTNLLLSATSTTPGVVYTWTTPSGGKPTGNDLAIKPAVFPKDAGNYSVVATKDGCTSESATVNAIIHPTPNKPTLEAQTICSGNNLELKSTISFAGDLNYSWTGPNSFTSTEKNPVRENAVKDFTGNYRLVVTSVIGGCVSAEASVNAIVHQTPVIEIETQNGPTECKSITGSITIKGLEQNKPYSVSYAKNGIVIIPKNFTSDASGRIIINNLSAGRYENIYVTNQGCKSNELGPVNLTDPNPPAIPTVISDIEICEGEVLKLEAAITSAGSVTYHWTGPQSWSSAVQNPERNGTLSSMSGNYLVTATVNNCTSPAGITKVVINPTPAIPVILGNDVLCSGSTLELNADTEFSGNLIYSWNGPDNFTSSAKSIVINLVEEKNAGTYNVIATALQGGCQSKEAASHVIVHQIPVIKAIPENPTECNKSNGTITITGLVAGQVYFVYMRKDGQQKAGLPFTANAKNEIIVPGLSKGTYSDIYVGYMNCPSEIVGPVVLKDPNPPATPEVISEIEICEGSPLKLEAKINSADPVSYNWTGPQSWNNTIQNPEIKETLPSMSGIYYVTATVNNCTSEAGLTKVIINPTPAIPSIIGSTPICTGSILKLNAETNFASDLIYTWKGPDNFTSSLKNIEINPVELKNAGDYSLMLTSVKGSCNSVVAVKRIEVNETPSINMILSDPTECNKANGSITITGLKAGESYFVHMLKDGKLTAPLDRKADLNNEILISNLSKGTYSEIHVVYKGCPSNKLETVVLKDPNPPQKPVVGDGMALCVGTTLDLKASSSEGNVSYSWRGPNGFLSNDQSPSILNVKPENAGSYFVKVIQANCVSEESEVVIVVDELPPPPSIVPVSYCIDAHAIPLSVTFPPGNIIKWYSEMTGGTGSIDAPIPSTLEVGTKAYYMTQTDPNKCESARGTLMVTVNPNAVADYKPITPINCPPFFITAGGIDLKKYPNNNSEYVWYADDVLIGSGDFPGYTINDADKSVVIKLKTISSFGCKADSISHTFSTFKVPKPSFKLSVDDGCGPLTVKIENTTPEISYFNYLWNFGNGQTSNKEQPDEVVFMPNPKYGDTTYYVSLKIITECEVMEKILPVHVKSKPKALFTPTATEGCSPMKVRFKNTSKGLNTTYHWDFGDGKTYDTNIAEDVEHTFFAGVVTNYTVRLTASNECGDDYSEFVITVAPNRIKLNFAMNGPDHFGCQPHTVTFFNNSSGASSYFWDFGDGNVKSTTQGVETVTHTYDIPGKYTVKLLASNNCSDTSTTDYVTVYPKPVAAFTPNLFTSCKGEEVLFSNQSQLATSYLWSFGDGSTSTLAEPRHLYTVPGVYTVRLTAYKLNGPGSTCTDVIEKQIQIVETLPGTFTMSDSKAECAPLTVTFTNENLPSVTAVWDFGDGSTASGDKVIHTYHFSGTYKVTLTTTSPGGCTYTSTKTVEVYGPSGTLQYAGGSACSPAPVRLEAIATNTSTYQWDFGDGIKQNTTDGVVFHEYTKPGTYLPSVTLLNNNGCNYFIKGKDSVKIDRIDGGFISTLEKTCGSTKVVFTDTSHVFFGKKSVRWNLGDGNIVVGNSAEYTYTTSGKYWIEMTVTGISGCTQTIRKQIDVQVNNIPAVSILAPVSECTNQAVSFRSSIQSEDALNTLRWTISNGVTGTGENFRYTFIQPGTYTVTFTAGTMNNCTTTATHNIEIKPSPVVKASGDVTICLGNSVKLNASGALQYQWSPLESLSCTTCPDPIATPKISTPYIVEGLNSVGCPAYDTVNVTVIQPLKMASSGNDTICIGQSANLMVSGAAIYKWTPAQALSSTTISNPVANPAITTTYRVVGYDGHNCFTDTAFIVVAVGKYPTVDLGPDKILATGTVLPLVSSYSEGPMKDWKWTPTTDLDCGNCAVPNAYIKKDITYALEVTNIYGCIASDTISIKVFCENSQVFIPNAFSPDGDGVNDVLMVRAKGIAMVKSFRIFNRWGQLVFERNNFAPNEPSFGWDGRIGGKPAPPEVYVYTAEVLCENGVPFTYKGNTTILK